VIIPKKAKAKRIVRLYAFQKIDTILAVSSSEDESKFDRSNSKIDFPQESEKWRVPEEFR
jgi:hypothetical protein